MGNLAVTYQYIADILSFESSTSKLEKSLTNPTFDWDAIVVEGSKHLVLPTIFCRLKAKQLLYVLPKELEIYLEDITAINRNRNTSILKQVRSIAQLLNKNKIEHVFLKGSALLALDSYEDIAERMIGDIDILVAKDQVNSAFELIKNNGYNNTFGYAYKTIGFRHLDRLISNSELAAIEIHSELLNPNYRDYIDLNKVLESKRVEGGVSIPSNYYLGKHHIYAWEINDNGYYYKTIHFKYLYDSIILNVFADKDLLRDVSKDKYGQMYLQLAQFYFNDFKGVSDNESATSYQTQHLNYLDNSVYKSLYKPIKKSYSYIHNRIKLITANKFYRQHLLKKILLKRFSVL